MSAAKAKEKVEKGSEAKVAEEVKIPDAPEKVEDQTPSVEDKPEETKVPDAPEKVEAVKTKEWIVCSGKSVTSKRGIIGAGNKVSPSDFTGGSDTMDSLKSRKIIELK